MHTIGNELKALAEMLMGGTGKTPVYSTARMPQLAEHEIVVNERWAEILTGFLQAGMPVLHALYANQWRFRWGCKALMRFNKPV